MEMPKIRTAEEVLKKKEEVRKQKMKENIELINNEMLSFEKALNAWEAEEDEKKYNPYYIELDVLIKSDEVKELLKNSGYIIDRFSNDIPVGTTRIWIDKKAYALAHASQLTDSKRDAYESLTKSCEKKDELIKLGDIKRDYFKKDDKEEISLADLLKTFGYYPVHLQ